MNRNKLHIQKAAKGIKKNFFINWFLCYLCDVQTRIKGSNKKIYAENFLLNCLKTKPLPTTIFQVRLHNKRKKRRIHLFYTCHILY